MSFCCGWFNTKSCMYSFNIKHELFLILLIWYSFYDYDFFSFCCWWFLNLLVAFIVLFFIFFLIFFRWIKQRLFQINWQEPTTWRLPQKKAPSKTAAEATYRDTGRREEARVATAETRTARALWSVAETTEAKAGSKTTTTRRAASCESTATATDAAAKTTAECCKYWILNIYNIIQLKSLKEGLAASGGCGHSRNFRSSWPIWLR